MLHAHLLADRRAQAAALARAGRLDEAVDAVVGAAEVASRSGPWSVTTKRFVPAGGGLDEFVHVAEYAWPDPRDPQLPWVIHDGRVNPDARQLAADGRQLAELADAVSALTCAAGLVGDSQWIARAQHLIDVWFTEPGTAMRPSLRHAVHVPGHPESMDWGLARLHPLLVVLDAVAVLEHGGRALDTVDRLRTWCADLLDWLLPSALFAAELARANNHATHAAALALGLAVFVDDPRAGDLAVQAADVIRSQVSADGSQPAEHGRTRSYFYSGYNLQAMLRVAELAWCCDLDLFGAEDAPRRALEALLPALVDPNRWPQRSVEKSDGGRHGDLLVRAAATWPGNERIARSLWESQIAPGPSDRVWVEFGLDPAMAARGARR